MFSTSYKNCSKFTFPVIISVKYFDGSLEASIGSFIVLNDQGNILTAAHLLSIESQAKRDAKEIKKYNETIQKIQKDYGKNQKAMQKKLKDIKPNHKWIIQHSYLWSTYNFQIYNFHIIGENDLALGKIDNFNPKLLSEYPVIKSDDNINPGTSLCRLGFPFINGINLSYDNTTNMFNISDIESGLAFFPNEGIFTRNVSTGKTEDGKHDILYLETSSPGLKGQSGGPIFDKNGYIWGIQSQTTSLSLGFSPIMQKGNKSIEEHQFLNVGWGVHPNVINRFLTENNIPYKKSSE